MLELHHWEPNGPALKPLIALKEKSIEFTSRYVDALSFEQYALKSFKPDIETTLNPEGEGPVLVHAGKQVTESLFMMEYLDEAFPQTALRPNDAYGRWHILAWARFVNEFFMPAASTLGCHRYLTPALKARNVRALPAALASHQLLWLRDAWQMALDNSYPEELLADSRRKVTLSIERLEEALTKSQWLVGTSYSIADVDAFAIANSLTTLTPDIVNAKDSPRTLDWLTRIRERPAVKAAMAMSKTGKPEEAFVPSAEHSRWG